MDVYERRHKGYVQLSCFTLMRVAIAEQANIRQPLLRHCFTNKRAYAAAKG
jgi:hypothetical protein